MRISDFPSKIADALALDGAAGRSETDPQRDSGRMPTGWFGTGIGALLNRRMIGMIAGAAVYLAIIGMETDLTATQSRLLGLLLMTVIFWVLRVLPLALTAILAMALAVVLKVAPAETVFGAFSTPTLFLLLGSFLLTAAMTKHHLAERMSLNMLLMHIIGGSTKRIIVACGAIAMLLSTVLDNGAVAAILLPITIGIARTFGPQTGDKIGDSKPSNFLCALLLMVAYGSTVGALLTPLGDASNLVAWEFMQRQSDVHVSIGLWILMALPTTIVLFAALCMLVIGMNRPEISSVEGTRETIGPKLAELGAMSRGEKNTLGVFIGAVIAWLMPTFVAAALGYGSEIHTFLVSRMPPAVVAIVAACLLFLLPAEKGHRTLEWSDTQKMNFGPLFLVGATLAMGSLMAETGLASVMSERLAGLAEFMNVAGVYAFAAGVAILFSELTTNLVSVTVLVPTIPGMAEAAGASALTATWIATFAAIYGFMLPISTSANAIVYGSGEVPLIRMIRTGFFVDLSGVALVVCGVVAMSWLLGMS